MLAINCTVTCLNQKYESVELSPEEIQNTKIFGIMTMTPKIEMVPYKTIQTSFSYVPFNNIRIFEKNDEIIHLSFKNNYDEVVKMIPIHPYNKVYTMNKGYVDVNNLGMMDVLVDGLGHICSIVSKERILHKGKYFVLETKYGNNIIVNDLIVSPR